MASGTRPTETIKERPIRPQLSSPFLRLSVEMRNKVYNYLFCSTRLTHGKRPIDRYNYKIMKPAAHSLAILYVCRQTNREASSFWVGTVLFHFEDGEDMLNKLSPLPTSTVSKIRHMRIGGRLLATSKPTDWSMKVLAKTLHLPPGLQLDTLTILGLPIIDLANSVLKELALFGNGWRELRYITPHSLLLDSLPCPLSWLSETPTFPGQTLLLRNGVDIEDSVFAYESTETGVTGAVMEPSMRKMLTKDNLVSRREFFRMSAKEKENYKGEMLHVVKRGLSADITQQGLRLSEYRKHRSDQNLVWRYGIRWYSETYELRRFRRYPSLAQGAEFAGVEEDQYSQVDEFEWNPLDGHFTTT